MDKSKTATADVRIELGRLRDYLAGTVAAGLNNETGKGGFMLKKVCFMFSRETACRLKKEIDALEKDLTEHGLVREGQDILYVTDQAGVYAALRSKGCYVLPYLHGNNREESFSGASYAVERLEEMDAESFDLAYRRLAGLPWEILGTERLLVRETTVQDVDSFYRIYAEPSITEYMENLFRDRDEEIAYTESYIKTVYAFYGYGMWTVLEKGSGKVVGRAGITWREGYGLPELGFVIGVPWQGRGYAFEVCAAILDYAREELLMKKVQALVRPGNERSLRLCEKLGFAVSGETGAAGERHLLLVKEL